jgi:hypothetical protein
MADRSINRSDTSHGIERRSDRYLIENEDELQVAANGHVLEHFTFVSGQNRLELHHICKTNTPSKHVPRDNIGRTYLRRWNSQDHFTALPLLRRVTCHHENCA